MTSTSFCFIQYTLPIASPTYKFRSPDIEESGLPSSVDFSMYKVVNYWYHRLLHRQLWALHVNHPQNYSEAPLFDVIWRTNILGQSLTIRDWSYTSSVINPVPRFYIRQVGKSTKILWNCKFRSPDIEVSQSLQRIENYRCNLNHFVSSFS